jgi:hypothetical protein
VLLEDKVVEDFGAQREELQQREDVEARGEEELPEVETEAVPDATAQLRNKLLGAIRLILSDETFEVGQLRLPEHEERALTSLQIAVTGRGDLGQFIYAYDRRDLLEQALAVLQPSMTQVGDKAAREMAGQFEDLSERVAELRGKLTNLEEAQDEVEGQLRREHGQDADSADKPKPKPSDPDAPRPSTTLVGPDLPAEPAKPTTLVGADLPPEKPRPTTLVGKELPEARPAPTTLVGPDLPAEPARPTTLIGAELPEAKPAPSTLGDPAELAAQAKIPWWRRPFG